MSILSLQNISFAYDKTPVLQNISYEFEKGKMYCIIGKSGAGKTTLLSLLSGLAKPTGGEIFYEDKNVAKIDKYTFRSKYIGVVFQSFNLITKYTALENVVLSMDVANYKAKNKKDRALELLKIVGLDEEEANRRVLKLSGGQQQRIAIARAIVNEPEILLLDEPLGALDLKMRKEMQLELKAMHKELGITFIYVTHDQEEALTMSDKVVVMSDGMIQQIGTPEEIYNEPKNVFVADFIGESNIFNGKMTDKLKVKFCDAEFECMDDIPVGSKVDVVIRPEDIVMTDSGRGMIDGLVTSVIFKGMHYEIIVESGVNEIVIQSTKSANVGDTIGMMVEPDGIHIIPAETNINIFDGTLTRNHTVLFADGEYECDITKLYPGSKINEDGILVNAENNEIDTDGVEVTVKVPVEAATMSDDTEAGGTCGHIISLIYKGDHYHYVVRTKSEEDIHLHDEYLWNEDDYVSVVIPKESIELTLK